MQTPRAGTPHSDDGFSTSNPYFAQQRRAQSEPRSHLTTDGGRSHSPERLVDDGNDSEVLEGKARSPESLDQLPFAESVKILSEAMKAQVRQNQTQSGSTGQGDDGASVHPKAGESLNHLLDSLSSALEKAGLEKGSHAALQRILGDIRSSTQYGPIAALGQAAQPGNPRGGILKGGTPGLLNLSA